MLKITKGLKKKKKDKKGKHKQEELFEEAELEQYRKEQEEKRRQQAEAGKEEGENKDKGEEWEKFKALTSGVDSILKKTQGDLDRIKSTSYFQRKPTPSELSTDKKEAEAAGGSDQVKKKDKSKDKKWIGFEDGTVDLVDEETPGLQEEDDQETGPTKSITQEENTERKDQEEPRQEEEPDDEDELYSEEEDIFDTSYVDAVASGEVKLAYIPDSPTENEDGFDPFDTSIAEQLIKEKPSKKKRRELLSLGCAVDVLTGKAEKPSFIPPDVIPKRSPRRQKQRDLLLESFDEGEHQDSEHSSYNKSDEAHEPVKTLLDDEPLNSDIQLDLTVNLAPALHVTSPLPQSEDDQTQASCHIQSILNEFDAIPSETENVEKSFSEQLQDDNNELEDEFAELAAASLTKEVPRSSPLTVLYDTQREDQPSCENVLKPVRPPPPVTQTLTKDSCEDDPFDTSFAAEILPGKCELRIIEEEILKSTCVEPIKAVTVQAQLQKSAVSLRDPLVFDEHNLLDDGQVPLSFKHRDLLGGSTSDLSKINYSPIEPALISDKPEQELSYCDPFDTSIVNDLVAPGKTELKFLEKELLSESCVNFTVENDNNFDPRAESIVRRQSASRPEQLLLNEKRQSLPKVVAFKIESPQPLPDLLSSNDCDTNKAAKPLTPYYPEQKRLENNLEEESQRDPFDTSFVFNNPGKLELKLIESELVGTVQKETVEVLPRQLSDPEFDPRASELSKQEEEQQLNTKIDILSCDEHVDTKLHTPVIPKRVEEELELTYSDPFDTSIAQQILPGKAELKLLENELIESQPIKRSYTDPDFNPRVEPTTLEKKDEVDNLGGCEVDLTQQPITDQVIEKPLSPLLATATFSTQHLDDSEIDPFDTTCVGSLIPGKVELKLLESELIHN